MGQVTKDTCEHIIAAADRDVRFPLTVNEMRQLAHLALRGMSAATVAEPSADVDNVWPIVNITVSEDGKVSEAKLYAPGLPPGNHDVYPVRVPYLDEHTEAWMAVAKTLAEVVPGYLDGSGNGIECAVKAIRRLAAQQQVEPVGDDLPQLPSPIREAWGNSYDPLFDVYGAEQMREYGRACQFNSRYGVYWRAIQTLLREVDPKWGDRGEFGIKPLEQVLMAIRDLATQSGQRAGVAEGWRLYSADFSMNARNPANWGTVMLTRDDSGSKWWHALSDEKREKIDLFVSGRGTTFDAALQAANEKAAIAAPTQQQEGE
ncbi:hypothetical protein [Ralstonia sp. 3PA37C10]|uniref:hypothetical protein n=1 Tax=Ralstonia sp. 3PA37C10 TaxID=2502217 RepID=UPI0010F68870|nr:hypothetical protein [Ralstonia sp. 3PA37C10]